MNRYVIMKDADPKFNIEMRQYAKVTEIYPELEDLRVTPTKETQVFQHLDSYGYDNVKVTAIPEEYVIPEGELNISDNGSYDISEYATANVKVSQKKYSPRYFYQKFIFQDYSGTELDQETTMLDTTHFTKMDNMFYECRNLTHLDLTGWNTSNVTSTRFMFYRTGFNCPSFTLDISNFNTSKVTEMTSMFNYLSPGVKELDLSHFDTSNVTKMSSMFAESKLQKINLKNWNTEKVTTMMNLFSFCRELIEADLSSFKISPDTNISRMFYYCQKLQKIDIRNFVFEGITNYSYMFESVPKNCLVIVKGQTEKDWVLAQRSDFTNVKTVAEYEASI